MTRPWLLPVWERMFVTEDEADVAYERVGEWLVAPLLADRLDGHTIRVYLDTKQLETRCQIVETEYEPPTIVSVCTCGHIAASHERDGECRACGNCNGFTLDHKEEGRRG